MANIILAIETSCDETSIAVFSDDNLLSLSTNTQIETFSKYGGVVPELSSRLHVDNLLYVYEAALKEADVSSKDIDYIAVTVGPGLKGSLLMGINFAKTLNMILNKTIIPINHLQAHIYSLLLDNVIKYPHLSLLVSGGHTDLVLLENELQFKSLGQTLDDAVGETYDKVARLLDLPYPGGPGIDKLAKTGQDTYNLPYPKNDLTLDFSFSGIKSAAYNLVNQKKMKNEIINKNNFAYSFQKRIITVLENKVELAKLKYQPQQISIVGGVSANSELRTTFLQNFSDVLIPRVEYSTDNAAMIGVLANQKIKNKKVNANLKINVFPDLKVENIV